MSMDIKEYLVPDGVVLTLAGDLTYLNRKEFTSIVEAVRQKGCRHLILNMAAVRFIDSSGLGLLALVSQHFQTAKGRLSLVNLPNYVQEIMALANIPKLIPVFDNEQAALAAYQVAM